MQIMIPPLSLCTNQLATYIGLQPDLNNTVQRAALLCMYFIIMLNIVDNYNLNNKVFFTTLQM